MIIAQGKRSAALGSGRKMIPSFFPSGLPRLWRAEPEGKKEVGWGRLFTQGGGLSGLALGHCLAAPPGRRKGESSRREDCPPASHTT